MERYGMTDHLGQIGVAGFHRWTELFYLVYPVPFSASEL